MNILIITELLAPYRVNWFNEIAKYANVTVLYTKDKEISRNKEWLSQKPNLCECKKLKETKILNFSICFGVIKNLNENYDIILLDGYGFLTQMLTILYLKLKNKKFIMNVDGGLIKEKENFIIKNVKKFFIKSPQYYLSSSKITDKYLKYYGAKESSIFHHNFTSLYKSDILSEQISIDEKESIKKELQIKEKNIILTVGRFIESKGFDILINSAKYILENSAVYIIGGKPTKQYIDLVEKNNINNIHFIEFKHKDELEKFYKSADLFVLPTRSDVWGLVINEAMAYGLPIITTDKCVAGLELVTNYENGFIVEVNNVKELADRINYIIKNDNIRYNMGKNSLIKIKEYTIEEMTNTHIKIFNNIKLKRI